MRRIRKIGVLSWARMQAIVFWVVGLLSAVLAFMTPIVTFIQTKRFDITTIIILFVVLPIVYAVIGFITGFVFALVYNALAVRFGGVEVELD